MIWILTKFIITAGLVVIVSETAKLNDKIGALVAALPLVTILTLLWLHIEGQPEEKVAAHSWYTFWYVLPTLPMFFIFPIILPKIGFWAALFFVSIFTMLFFIVYALTLKYFGINLL